MHSQMISTLVVRAKALFTLFAVALIVLLARASLAQGPLPIQWLQSPINPAFDEGYAPASGAAYSPDGRLLAVSGPGGIQIYGVSSRELVATLPTAAPVVSSLAFSPDGKTLADGGGTAPPFSSTTGTLELWNVSTWQLISTFATNAGYVSSIVFSPDGKTLVDGGFRYVASDSWKGTVELWNVAARTLVSRPAINVDEVDAVAFSPDGRTLAFGGVISYNSPNEAGLLELWDVAGLRLLRTLSTGMIEVYSVAFSPNGKTIAAGGYGGPSDLEMWDVARGALQSSLPSQGWLISSVAFSPDGKTLADGSEMYGTATPYAGILELWDLSSSARTAPNTAANGGLGAVAFSPDGKTVADAGATMTNGLLETWDISHGLDSIDQGAFYYTGAFYNDEPVAFSPDGTMIAGSGGASNDGLLNMWDVSTGALTASFPTAARYAIQSVTFSKDGKSLADGGYNTTSTAFVDYGVVELWDIASGTSESFPTSASIVSAVALSPGGKTIVDGGTVYDPTSPNYFASVLELWDVDSGSRIASLPTDINYAVYSVAISPDGNTLAVGGVSSGIGNVLELWSMSTGNRMATLPALGFQVNSLAFSPDGRRLVTGGQGFTQYPNYTGEAQLWDVTSGNLLDSFSLVASTSLVSAIAFSPDGNVVFAGTPTNVQVFSSVTGKMLGYHNIGGVSSVTVSPNGHQLAYGAGSGTIAIAANPYYGGARISQVGASPSEVVGGRNSTGTVALSTAAPTGGNIVLLSSDNPAATVPAFVTVPAGATSATFKITTSPVDADTPVVISATSDGGKATTRLVIDAAAVAGIALSRDTVTGGTEASVAGIVTMNGPAPTSGYRVTLSSSAPSVASVPSSITVSAEASSVTFPVTHYFVRSSQTVTISASLGGVTKTATLTVNPLDITGLTISPSHLIGGASATGTVSLKAAVQGAATVSLATTSPGIGIPASVTVPAGASSATFTITTKPVTTAWTASITATFGSSSNTATMYIAPATLELVAIDPATVQGSGSTIVVGTVVLTGPAPSGGSVVTLKSSNLSAATVPTTVTVPAGRAAATFTVTHKAVTAQTSVTISATYAKLTRSAALTITP